MLGTQLYLLPKGKRFAIHPILRYMVIGHGKAQALQKFILSETKNWSPIEWGVEKHPLVISYACLALRSARSSQHIDISCPPMVFINMQHGNSINYGIKKSQHRHETTRQQRNMRSAKTKIIKRCTKHQQWQCPNQWRPQR